MVHKELSTVKHLAAVQAAIREYKAVYSVGGQALKAAENKLNAAVEKAISPKA